MVEHSALVDGDDVRDSVSAIDNDARRKTLGIEGEDGLDGDIDTAKVVPLKHDFGHLLSIAEGVHGWLSEEDLAARGINLHLVVEGVVPDVLHVVPALYNAILHL